MNSPLTIEKPVKDKLIQIRVTEEQMFYVNKMVKRYAKILGDDRSTFILNCIDRTVTVLEKKRNQKKGAWYENLCCMFISL